MDTSDELDSPRLLERLGLGVDPGLPEVDVFHADDPYRAFGISRKAWGGEPMIDFVHRTGNHHALAYAHLNLVSYDPSTGIILTFAEHVVTLRGRRLAEGFQKLLMHRVVFAAEANRATATLAPPDQPVILELSILPRQPGQPADLSST